MPKDTDSSAENPSLADLLRKQNPFEWHSLLTNMALAIVESQRLMTEVLAGSGPLGTIANGDPMGAMEAFQAVGTSLATDPSSLMKAQMELVSAYGALLPELMTSEAKSKDKRFKDPEWATNPQFRFIQKMYDINSQWLMSLTENADVKDENIKRRANFFTKMIVETLSPTNFFATNPTALKAAMETGGESVLEGLRMARQDIKDAGGKLVIQQSDESVYELGKNIATAGGQVVFRNDLIELIQFTPTQDTVYSRPLVIFPPWINKFYILDLQEKNSMIRWLVDKGITLFIVSWRSADEVTKKYTWDDYAEQGVYAAIDAVCEASGSKTVNAVGYCIGGTMLSTCLAHMAKTGDTRINSATFFACQTDFELSGDLMVFTDGPGRNHVATIIEENGGVMPGAQMYETFNWLRPIDLVWRYVIDQYMLGKPLKPFDLLYWNADQTNIPGDVHKRYLNDFYAQNLYSKGKFQLLGETVGPSDVEIPTFVQGGRADHICPIESVYRTHRNFGGKSKFCMAGSGHIAGVVNHPDAKKYQHWVNDTGTPDAVKEWFENAEEIEGSWWPTWWDWLRPKSGRKRKAVFPFDKGLGAAPGTYAKVRLKDIPLPLED